MFTQWVESFKDFSGSVDHKVEKLVDFPSFFFVADECEGDEPTTEEDGPVEFRDPLLTVLRTLLEPCDSNQKRNSGEDAEEA